MARPRKLESQSVEGEVITTMKVLHMVRVLSRGVQGVPPNDVSAGLFNARDVEKEIEGLLKQGWKLMGQPQFTGMEQWGVIPDAGFRMLYFFTKEEDVVIDTGTGVGKVVREKKEE